MLGGEVEHPVSQRTLRLREACANPVVITPMDASELKPAQLRRLRFIFEKGRPILLTSKPFIPWPGYVDEESKPLAKLLREMQDKALQVR